MCGLAGIASVGGAPLSPGARDVLTRMGHAVAHRGPDDSGTNGRWVPTTGSVQYAATLASWFGVSPSQMATIFPNIGSFPTMNLGFV